MVVPEPEPVPVPGRDLPMDRFDHEKLDVYQASIEFVTLCDDSVEHLPRGRAYRADQLQRAGTSIPLNIAEGAGEYSRNEKARFYRMAKRSATECAAILDVCHRLGLLETPGFQTGRKLLLRIVAMLTQMARRTAASGTGTGTGSTCQQRDRTM